MRPSSCRSSLRFVVDGTVIVYLTFLAKKRHLAVQDINRQLRVAVERTREIIELAPEAFFRPVSTPDE